jgi:hypothetical protein
MILQTGGLAFGATSTRSRSASAATRSASSMRTMPTCSPPGPINRTSGTRMRSLTRVSVLMGPPWVGVVVLQSRPAPGPVRIRKWKTTPSAEKPRTSRAHADRSRLEMIQAARVTAEQALDDACDRTAESLERFSWPAVGVGLHLLSWRSPGDGRSGQFSSTGVFSRTSATGGRPYGPPAATGAWPNRPRAAIGVRSRTPPGSSSCTWRFARLFSD